MNIVVVVIDSLRKDHVGAYGNNWIRTPHLDAFAKESMTYTAAYPESLPTLPVRRALHTGRRCYPFPELDGAPDGTYAYPAWGPIPENQRSVSSLLQGNGLPDRPDLGLLSHVQKRHELQPRLYHLGMGSRAGGGQLQERSQDHRRRGDVLHPGGQPQQPPPDAVHEDVPDEQRPSGRRGPLLRPGVPFRRPLDRGKPGRKLVLPDARFL